MYLDGPQHVSPIKKKKGSNVTFAKRSKRHEMRVTNQLQKNYSTTLVFFIKFHYEHQTYFIMAC
jgi:hypothetical protein